MLAPSMLREFILPYDDMRRSADSERTLLIFPQSIYVAAADLGVWGRALLESLAEASRAVSAA